MKFGYTQVWESPRQTTEMFPPSKRTMPVAISVFVRATIGLLYVWRQEAKRPRRVSVTYSEKWRSADDSKKEWPTDNDEILVEQKLNHACFVLTRNKARADYLVSIQVIRYMGGDTFGEAKLNILNAHGDVVLAETFFQDRTSKEDIAQQPITETWNTLCAPPSAGAK